MVVREGQDSRQILENGIQMSVDMHWIRLSQENS
jgi:hypothetical protein